MIDPANLKLGKLPPDPTKPRLKLRSFLKARELTPPPPTADWMSQITRWPLYRNDEVGCCTIVSQGHALGALSTYGSGNKVWVNDDDIIRAYSDVSGYDPETGANDTGAYVQDTLNHWRTIGLGGHKIVAFAEVNHNDRAEVEQAIDLFGSIILGIALPVTAQSQTGPSRVWDFVPGAAGSERYSWGGHATAMGGYDRDAQRLYLSTWGNVQAMSDAFWDTYVDEAWVVITPEWIRANGTSPRGVDLYGLGEDFAALTGESNPFLDPIPTPDPDPVPTPDPIPTLSWIQRLIQWILKILGLRT